MQAPIQFLLGAISKSSVDNLSFNVDHNSLGEIYRYSALKTLSNVDRKYQFLDQRLTNTRDWVAFSLHGFGGFNFLMNLRTKHILSEDYPNSDLLFVDKDGNEVKDELYFKSTSQAAKKLKWFGGLSDYKVIRGVEAASCRTDTDGSYFSYTPNTKNINLSNQKNHNGNNYISV